MGHMDIILLQFASPQFYQLLYTSTPLLSQGSRHRIFRISSVMMLDIEILEAIMLQHISDLTGKTCPETPNYLCIRSRINQLIEKYIAPVILSEHLTDLPVQFTQPHQRPWNRIDWKGIHYSQIRGIDPALFVQILAGAAEIESPIRGYSRESWDYMRSLHEPMAHFLGGTYGEDESIQVVGIWEKEERQHCPALKKIYLQLTGHKLSIKPNAVAGYQPVGTPWEDAGLFMSLAIEEEKRA